jgi:hypothetical protein
MLCLDNPSLPSLWLTLYLMHHRLLCPFTVQNL